MTTTEVKSKAQLQRLKWITLGLTAVVIVLIHLFYVFMPRTTALQNVVDGLLSFAVVFALVRFVFHFAFRIQRETERRAEEIAALRETMLDIAGRLDMPQLLASVIERASKLVGATGGLVHLYNAQRGELRCYVSHNLDKDYTGLTLAVGEGVAGKVIQRGQPLIVADHRTWEGKSPQVDDTTVIGVIGVPLQWQGEIIGVLDIMDTTGKKVFDERDARVLSLLADQAALAIQNARLYAAQQQRARVSELLLDIAQAATSSLELTKVLKLISQRTAQACGADRCTILLLEKGERLVPAMSQFASGKADERMWRLFKDLRYPRLLAEVPEAQQVLREGRPLFIPDALSSSLPRHWIEPFQAKSVLMVPLMSKGRPVGIMGLDHMEEGKSFTEEQVNLAMTIGAQAAIIIQNARLYQQVQDQLNELRFLQEASSTLQSSLSLQEVLDRIVRAVVELGYAAAMLAQYEEETNRLTVQAHSVDPNLLETGEALAGMRMIGAYVTLDQTENLGVRMALAGEIGITHSLHDLFRPLVSAEVCQTIQEIAGLKTMITIPLMAKGRLVGNMFVGTEREEISENELDTLRAFVNQAAMTIENARLYEETRRRSERLAVINRIARAAGATLHLDELVEVVYQEITRVFQADAFFLALYDQEANELDYRLRVDEGMREPPERRPMKAGLTAQVVTNKKPLLIRDFEKEKDRLPPAQLWGTMKAPLSWLGVPMLIGDRVVGVVSVQAYRAQAYGEEEQFLLSTIADQIAVAIENARLYDAEQRRRQEAETLQEVAQVLNQALSLEETLDIVLREAMALVGRKEGSIILLDRETDTWRIVASYGLASDVVEDFNSRPVYAHEGTFGIVLETGEMLEIAEARSDPRVLQDVGHVPAQLTNVPLRSEEGVIGVIALDGLPPNQRARRLLLALADMAAVAIQRLRLFEEERQRRQEAETLRRAAQALSTTLDLDRVFETILSELQRVVPYDSASVQILKGDRLEIIGGHGFPNLEELLGISFPVDGDNPNREVMRTLQPFILEDAPTVYEEFTKEPFAQMGIRSWLGVPMLIGQRPVGMITLDKCQPGFYTQEHARLALAFATQAAIAIENARLFGQARQRVAELEALQRTSLQLISSLDLPSVLDSIAESALSLVGATDCHIYLYDAASETFTFGTALRQDGRREPAVKAPRPDGFTATVARRGRPMVINEAPHHPLYSTPEAQKWGVQAIAGFPLKRAGQVLGVFNIAFLEPHTFSEEELRVLGLLADQAAIAVENARLYDETQRHLRELSMLNEINAILTSTLNLEDMLTSLMEGVCQAMEVEAGSLFLVDEEKQELVFFVALGEKEAQIKRTRLPLGTGIAGWVVQHGEPLLVPDARQDPRHYPGVDRLAGFVTRSVLCVPLKIRGKVLGCIELINKVKEEFSRDDLRLLSAVAASAAAAIENAQLYKEIKQHATYLEERVAERTAEIQREKERTEAILHSVADAVIVTDLEGNIVEVNPVAEHWLTFHGNGWVMPNAPLRHLVRQLAKGDLSVVDSFVEFPDLTQPEHRACWEELGCDQVDCPAYGAEERRCWLITGTLCGPEAKKALSAEEKYATCKECPRCQRLKRVSFQARASPLTEEGQVNGWVVVLHDVTRLHELDRLKSEFVSNVSHELRTPLTNIKIYLSLLRKRKAKWKKQEQYLRTVEQEVARLEKLIEDLLDLSRLETGAARPEKELLDVAEVVQQVLAVHRPLAESKEIRLSCELPPELPPLLADRDQTIQLLTNLLGNALNYTPPGGEVTVRAASVRRDGGDWLILAVQDTGLGIPPEERERIFDRFYRGKKARHMAPGTGLGLAIVKEILALHEGFIELESEVGVGSTFTAWLPLGE